MERPKVVPRLVPSAEQSLEQLKLVTERVRYILQWIATTPARLVDGEHHQVLEDAVSDLLLRVNDTELTGVFHRARSRLDGANATLDPKTEKSMLELLMIEHGLTGKEWSLKFEAFDRQFREFRNRAALLEAQIAGLSARLLDVETADFLVKLRQGASGSLGMGQTILKSATEVLSEVPGAKALFGTCDEAAGALKSLMAD